MQSDISLTFGPSLMINVYKNLDDPWENYSNKARVADNSLNIIILRESGWIF